MRVYVRMHVRVHVRVLACACVRAQRQVASGARPAKSWAGWLAGWLAGRLAGWHRLMANRLTRRPTHGISR